MAYRNDHRWIPGWEPAPLPAISGAPPRLRPRGVYLITGGLGGIGLALAEHLASRVQARLVLIGRTSLPSRSTWPMSDDAQGHGLPAETLRRIRAVQRIEKLGGQVVMAKADVARVEEVRAAVSLAEQTWGPLDGVIHTAGVAGGGLTVLKTPEAADAVLSPKVDGLVALLDALGDRRLDFLALCSSVNAIVGGVGQVDYCAANRFLDAFAAWDCGRSGRVTVSLNWDTWQEVGMAVNTAVPALLRAQREASLKLAIRPEEGVEAFLRSLASPVAQRVISPRDWVRLVGAEQRSSALPHSAPTEVAPESLTTAPARHKARHPRPPLLRPLVEPRTDLERTLVALWQELLGVEPIGVEDDFLELGGHSLLAVQMNARVREIFGIELPINTVFESPTISALAVAVVEVQTRELGDEELLGLVEDIAGLSPEELEQRLRAERKEPGDA